MLELLGKLNARITELNYGSCVVDDREAPRVGALLPASCPNAAKAHAAAGRFMRATGSPQ